MSEIINCGTFLDWSFGGLLRRYRTQKKITLREFCKSIGVDAGNYSKLESSKLSPPKSIQGIEFYVTLLDLNSIQRESLLVAAYNFHIGELKKRFNK